MFGWNRDREETRDHSPAVEGEMSPEEKILRLAAEVENTRRRARRDVADAARRERARLMTELLDVVDNFDRALAAPGAEDSTWLEGMRGVRAQLLDVLARYGARSFDALGEAFDPNRHDAVAVVPFHDAPPGTPDTVAEVQQTGYELEDGTILRPARVVVAQPAPE